MGRALKFFVVAMSVVVAIFLIALLAVLGWMKCIGLFDGHDLYSALACRHLQGVIEDDGTGEALVQWVDNDLERTLQDWVDNDPSFPPLGGSLGGAYFEKYDFDGTLLGYTSGDYLYWSKVKLVTRNPKVPHHPQSEISPEEGIEYLLSITRSVSFTDTTFPNVALLVRQQDSPNFGVDPSHIKAESGRLAVYCEPSG